MDGSLRTLFTLAAGAAPITLNGNDWPALSLFSVDLNGAAVRAQTLERKPGMAIGRQPAFSAARVQVSAKPVKYQNAAAEFSVSASDAKFDFAKDSDGHVVLALSAASDGQLDASIGKRDLESLLMAVAKPLAAAKGVGIDRIEIMLSSSGPRSLAIEARIAVRKMLSAVIRVSGQLAIDDQLVARLSDLQAAGEGMIGTMAVNFIQPQLRELEHRELPLVSFSIGDVRLRDVKLQTPAGGVHVHASFGS